MVRYAQKKSAPTRNPFLRTEGTPTVELWLLLLLLLLISVAWLKTWD